MRRIFGEDGIVGGRVRRALDRAPLGWGEARALERGLRVQKFAGSGNRFPDTVKVWWEHIVKKQIPGGKE